MSKKACMMAAALFTLVCVKAYEYGEEFVARRVAEREAAARMAKWEESAERRAALVRAARWSEFFEARDPLDTAIWFTLVPYAELDEACNALPECTQEAARITRPMSVTTYGDLDAAEYTAVLGIEARTPQGKVVIPQITYYVGSRGGVLWRMGTDATQAGVRTPRTNEWREIEQSTSDAMRDDVRNAFIRELAGRLSKAGPQ